MSRSTFLGSPILLPPLSTAVRRRRLKMAASQNPITTVTRLLWGQSLPPNLLVSTARSTWSAAWHLMMSQLAPSDSAGRYTRPSSSFRLCLPLPRRTLHLYVGLPCPWAHRTLIVRALKGLHAAVHVSVASPGTDGLWEFRPVAGDTSVVAPGLDEANGCRTLKEVYNLRRGGYGGRSTVPMLWDGDSKEVVCNESYDIIEFFNSGLNDVATNPGLDLAPPPLKKEIDRWNKIIYPNINNGVYRCGFAQSQEAYDSAANELFSTLEMVEEHLGSNRYLCGDTLTLADVCLFTTLVRFDLVYNVLFKCTKKKLLEYQNLHGYTRDIYQISGVAETCNFGAIMDGYYKTLFPLNPSNIRPAIPAACEREALASPHNRDFLSLSTVV
ncbi:glutathionyl-hydroquinone reductase [Salvia divinorum]|uniref:Glutathionyl-hydroquinone reductase n=1 Tax=Salvia divinorum TaxID=28513 RepID=A0ABD1H108_SALDI